MSSKESNHCGLSSPSGTINGHKYVELGLSVKWAICNLGACSTYGHGDYYAWGETESKAEYTEENSVMYDKEIISIAGDPKYDAATANWGTPWRMPTREEVEELIEKCTREWIEQGRYKGYKIIGPNGNSIFFPVAGYRYEKVKGKHGRYWSGSPDEDCSTYACYYSFYNEWYGERFDKSWYYRYYGQTIRPVTD